MKKKNLLKVGAAAMALTVGVTCFAGCGTKNYAENNTEYYFGCSGPLTGGAAVYGTAVKNSAQMAVNEINAAGGINGVKIKFVMTDDAHDATKVAANYATMYEAGMQVSLGCVTTKPCLEFKGYAEQDKLFTLTPSASGDDVTEDCDNMYQMCFTDSSQGAEAAKYVKDAYPTKNVKLGVLYKAGDDYSEGLYNNFKTELGTEWESVMTVASFTEENDLTSQANNLKDCDFIFMPVYYGPAKTFMLQGKSIMKSDAIYFGCDGFDGIDTIEGFDLTQISQEVSMLSHFNSNAKEGKAKEFVDKYVAAYGKDTLSQFGAAAYDCVYAIAQAMEEAMDEGTEIPANISPAALNEILTAKFQSASFSYSGATGTNIKWNTDGTVNKVASKYVIKEYGIKAD